MAKGFGIHGSTTDHGGIVFSTQSTSSQMGSLFLRAGDGFACPKCKIWSTLIKSNDHVVFDGKPVAYVGDKFTCSATLMLKQMHVVGDSGGSNYRISTVSSLQPVSSQQNLTNSLVEDKKEEEKKECFCDRDIKLPEFLEIIQGMRDSEKIKGTVILNDPRCVVVGDRSHTKLLDHLNKTLTKYEINTCIRKIHFLTQTYWEGDRFRTTSEYDKGDYLNPGKHPDANANGNTVLGDGPRYKGRGFMQLTWRNNYERYFKFMLENNADYSSYLPKEITLNQLLDRKNSYSEIVAKDFFLATDSAGWFWIHGKILSRGRSGNLNILADADNVKKISLWVNGGNNGGKERVAYWTNLKKVMNYDQCKNKK